ncbi:MULTISPECIES: NAD(P)-dependent oxidoreductase [Chitinophagaceae]
MKKIAVIGATGFVGSHLVKEALGRGLGVVAIARNTSQLESHDHLKKVDLDATDADALEKALAEHEVDVVVSAFNAGWGNPNLYDDFLNGSKKIEAAVAKTGVKRLIVIGGAGSLYIDGKQLVDSPEFPQEYKAGATAARDYANILKANETLDWTFFSPAIEMNPHVTTGRTGHYRIGADTPVFDSNGKSVLSVEDLAVAILDEVENPQFIRKRFTAAY